MKKVQRIDGFEPGVYAKLQGDLVEDFLGISLEDVKPKRPVWCVTFKYGPLKPFFLEVEASTEADARLYMVQHFPLDGYTTYPQSLFNTLGAALGPLNKLNEVRLP